MTRAEAIATIRKMATPAMLEEFHYLMNEVEREPEDWENGYDEVDALGDFHDAAESAAYHEKDRAARADEHRCILIYAALGNYEAIDDDEANYRRRCISPVQPLHKYPKIGGKRYDYIGPGRSSWEESLTR